MSEKEKGNGVAGKKQTTQPVRIRITKDKPDPNKVWKPMTGDSNPLNITAEEGKKKS